MTRGSLIITAAIGLIVATCSCAGNLRSRQMIDRLAYASSYRVLATCLDGAVLGSAVAISPRHLLTAKHVVECDGAGPVVAYVIGQGGWIEVTIDRASTEHDVARLVVLGTAAPLRYHSRVSNRLPSIGETLCIIGGDVLMAHSMRKCGDVGYVGDGLAVLSLHVVQGNSGGPLFDRNGDVLGIVSRGRWQAAGEFVLVATLAGALGDLGFPSVPMEMD